MKGFITRIFVNPIILQIVVIFFYLFLTVDVYL